MTEPVTPEAGATEGSSAESSAQLAAEGTTAVSGAPVANGAGIDSPDDAPDDAPDSGSSAGSPRTTSLERLEREGEIAADYLETLLDVTDLDGDIDVDIDGDRAAVAIVDSEEGRVPRRLVGRDGEVLEALQELTRLAVLVGRDGEVLEALQELTRLAVLAASGERSRLMLDIAGHRAGRREALVKRAQEVVAQVRASGAPVSLEPMSPFERKVVHDAVAAAGLATESEGVEPDRHVVVLPA